MFKNLLPKEEKFFEDFNRLMANLIEMVKLSQDFFQDAKYSDEIEMKLKSLEKRCDEGSQKVIKKLNKSFLTPFDREDIFDLVRKMEKVSDDLYAASARVKLYNLSSPVKAAEKLLQIASIQTRELSVSIVENKFKRTDNLKIVKDLEEEADQLYREAISRLFKEETNAIELIKQKEVLEVLEMVTNRCQAVASVITSISLKNN